MHLGKEYFLSDCTYGANIWMPGVQGGDLLDLTMISSQFSILAKLLLAKIPKLGIQLPNAGDDKQSCRILTVIFNQIDQSQIMNYNLYSSTLFYTNVSISKALRVGEPQNNEIYIKINATLIDLIV